MIPAHRRSMRRLGAVLAIVLTSVPVVLGTSSPVGAAPPSELIFSEYIEGSSNNKALEIFNGTGAPVDLAAGAYNIQMFFNGSASAGLTIPLAGTVAAGDVHVVAQSSAAAAILAQADQTNGAGWFNGDDAVVLRKGTTIVDSIGQVGFDPGAEWGTGLTSTSDNTIRRKADCALDANVSDAFDPATGWDGFANDTFNGLGAFESQCIVTVAAPSVTAFTPAPNAVNVGWDVKPTVTFNVAVNAAPGAFSLVCNATGAREVIVSGGPTTFTLTPTGYLGNGETCTVTVTAALVTAAAAPNPPMAADATSMFTTIGAGSCGDAATPIDAIQGPGAGAALPGLQLVEGVVVGDYQGAGQFSGFHVQEEDVDADLDPATSEGLFIFNTSFPVAIGDVVRITGTAGEFSGMTQLSSVTSVQVCSSGASDAVTPAVVDLPVASLDEMERFEAMSVTFVDELTVTETFTLGRFGELTLSAGGRQYTPTAVVAPGAPATALQDVNNRSRIVLDDGINLQNPDPVIYPAGGLSAANPVRSGDTVPSLSGVLEFRFSVYRVQPTGPVTIVASNPRPAAPADVGGRIQVASFNVLNYFNGDGLGGGFPTARGANTPDEFARQRAKTIAAISVLDADVIGLMELENDAGPTSALADLVAGLNDVAGPGTYSYIDTGVVGTDAIKVALIYRTAAVEPVGDYAILDSSVDSRFIDTLNRPALAQTFEDIHGDRYTVVVNHLKSKGSDCNSAGDPDVGDGQGNCNLTRTAAAEALADWLATDPTGSGDPDVLIIGDLNSYAKEDPITALLNAGYTNTVAQFGGSTAYSYVFGGQSGYLDHALANATLAPQVTGVTDWHINADEPIALDYNVEFKSAGQVASFYAPDAYRASDHDPVKIGLCPVDEPELSVSVAPSVLKVVNHKYVTVTGTPTVSSDVVSVELISVTSNEPDDGADDGSTTNDTVIDSDLTARVRAERSGTGTGRVYTFTFEATNDCGITTTATAEVRVPVGRGGLPS